MTVVRVCRNVALATLLIWEASPSRVIAEALTLRPFIGETVQEFEARKRGVRPESVDARGGVFMVPADPRGHFFVEPTLGSQRIRMLVDTGASLVALSHEDAERVSLSVTPRDFTQKIATANGVVEAAPIRIPEIQVGDITVRNVEAVVLPPGRLNVSLLGMTFLRRLSAIEVVDGRLALRQ
jgi:aspartyl protease family protein